MALFADVSKAIKAIAEGHEYSIGSLLLPNSPVYITINNPDFQEDDGSNPKLVIVIKEDK